MKKLIYLIILVLIGLGAYAYFTQDAVTPIAEDMMEDEMVEDVMDTEDEMMEISYMDISVEEAVTLIDENPDLIIVDVSPKYDEGHLPGAVNYYVGDGSLDDAIPTLDAEAMYLVYCHVDSASIAGAQALIDAGFTNVYRLEGNYAAWTDAGYAVE
ncbi:rhodanese-like domain-containing protein [Patescibacteria group bacterium]|nr:rhodanese-like domain-containing protein [Patescibacteria group bacterium]MBU1934541.1 rhodanese-like domain-containing protein [Patescibacteria group bacterium]